MNSQEYEWWGMQIQTMLTKATYKRKKGGKEGKKVEFIFIKLNIELKLLLLVTLLGCDHCYSIGKMIFL